MDETYDGWEDYDFWLRILADGQGGKIIKEDLYFYRRHKNGMTGVITSKQPDPKKIHDMLKARNSRTYGMAENNFTTHL